jgi:hypothetical protein
MGPLVAVKFSNLSFVFVAAGLLCVPVSSSSACVEYYLTGTELRSLLPDHTLIGVTAYGKLWKEYLNSDGQTIFQSDEGQLAEGVWEIQGDQVCFSYGSLSEYKCKSVLLVEGCNFRNGTFYVSNQLERSITSQIVGFESGNLIPSSANP